MGWLRLVGSLKLQVSFAKEPYKRDCILQKRPTILRSLLSIATPYDSCMCVTALYDKVEERESVRERLCVFVLIKGGICSNVTSL